MSQAHNEDTTCMLEVQTKRIIQLENELEASKKRMANLEQIIKMNQLLRHDLLQQIDDLKDAVDGKA